MKKDLHKNIVSKTVVLVIALVFILSALITAISSHTENPDIISSSEDDKIYIGIEYSFNDVVYRGSR